MSRPSCKVLDLSTGEWCTEEATVLVTHRLHGEEIGTLVCAPHAHELTASLNARGITTTVEPLTGNTVNQNLVAVERAAGRN